MCCWLCSLFRSDLRTENAYYFILLYILSTESRIRRTTWPSGLRRNVKAVVFVGVGSNPTVVILYFKGLIFNVTYVLYYSCLGPNTLQHVTCTCSRSVKNSYAIDPRFKTRCASFLSGRSIRSHKYYAQDMLEIRRWVTCQHWRCEKAHFVEVTRRGIKITNETPFDSILN